MVKEIYRHLRYGDWSWGYESWEGKPLFSLSRDWVDGWHYVLHIGKLWIECDY